MDAATGTPETNGIRARYPEVADEQLVLAALVGDLAAFDELVRRFRGAVTLVAAQTLGTRNGAAEDVAQDAFLIAFKALPQLGEPAKFAGWLYAITRHRALRVGAKNNRADTIEPSEVDRALLAGSRELAFAASKQAENPADTLARNDDHEQLACALTALAPDYRTVLFLFYYEDWPVARIADFLSLPVTTVKWRLHNGRALLRRHLTTTSFEEKPSHESDDSSRRIRRTGKGDRSAPSAPPVERHRRSRAAREPDRQPSRGCSHGHAPL
jgi:RNA polymerase sigma-70 factor (ECF subfamily)